MKNMLIWLLLQSAILQQNVKGFLQSPSLVKIHEHVLATSSSVAARKEPTQKQKEKGPLAIQVPKKKARNVTEGPSETVMQPMFKGQTTHHRQKKGRKGRSPPLLTDGIRIEDYRCDGGRGRG